YCLENQSPHKLSDEEIAGSLFGTNSDMTAIVIMCAVITSACYPKAQEKVQEQLDIIVGLDRGMSRLILVNEPQPGCYSSHIQLYFPSTDRSVHVEVAIPHDPVFTSNPTSSTLRPERWLNRKGKICNNIKFTSYGFGHRFFINITLLLYLFTITWDPENWVDEMGFVNGVILHPTPFTAHFQPQFGYEPSLRDVMAQYGEGL
ncbi:uncharacterized protein BJ212DRAFT_1261491, partial [Suillus subaureus]